MRGVPESYQRAGRPAPGNDADRPRERRELLVLDTAPNVDQTASLAVRAADLLLVPCRPARFDLETIETTLLLTRAAGKPRLCKF